MIIFIKESDSFTFEYLLKSLNKYSNYLEEKILDNKRKLKSLIRILFQNNY